MNFNCFLVHSMTVGVMRYFIFKIQIGIGISFLDFINNEMFITILIVKQIIQY